MNRILIARELMKLARLVLDAPENIRETTTKEQSSAAIDSVGIVSEELKNIEEIVFIITDEPLSTDMRRFASNPRNTCFSLAEIKQLLACKPARIVYKHREDGRNNPLLIDITMEEALEIMSNLKESDYNKERSINFPGTDVYLKEKYKVKTANLPLIDIYIKLAVKGKGNRRHVLVISFHEDEK